MISRPFHPAHVAAVRAAEAGNGLVAGGAFANALTMLQGDARFLTDYAIFATTIGDFALAASLYAKAIAATPGDALSLRLRHALALMDAGKLLESITILQALTRDHSTSVTAWQALGAAHKQADHASAAADAFDRALAIAPSDPLARLSRAQMLAELGEPAVEAFIAAVAVDRGNGPARLGLSAAQAAAGDFEAAVGTLRIGLKNVDWSDGWAALASLTYRWKGREAGLSILTEALAAMPGDAALANATLRNMDAMGAHADVLVCLPAVRASIGDTLPLALIEARAASESGDIARADAAFDRLRAIDDDVVRLARVRHALRAGRPDKAAVLGEAMMKSGAARFAIPYLGTAWRLLGDPRYDWLEGDTRLVGCHDLDIDPASLADLAAELRTLHTARHPPFEQSMRGGTQTEGVLLSRQSRAIRDLRSALERAIRSYIDQLPPHDPTHPTLSEPRGQFRFSGSWSVRLSGGGRHVNHVHSEGWISSACYIALPSAMATAHDAAGWLTLGEPPSELASGLAPIRTVRPVVGQVVLFPSTMWHGTRPAAAGERLTVAFDVRPLT